MSKLIDKTIPNKKDVKVYRARPRRSERGHNNPDPSDLGVIKEIPERWALNKKFMEREGYEVYNGEISQPKPEPKKEVKPKVKK